MATKSHPGDPCPKCGSKGTITSYQYVRQGDTRSNSVCNGCPFTEHLHVSCTACGYTISAPTEDSVVKEEMSAATPVPAKQTAPAPTRPDPN